MQREGRSHKLQGEAEKLQGENKRKEEEDTLESQLLL